MHSSFLFTNREPPTHHEFFRGYAFIGSDYVYGERGAERFRAETGHRINAGHDGCYVTMRRQDGAWIFATGHGGFRNILYYHDGANWAVSDSFVRINEYLRSVFGHVEPHYAALASYGRANGFKQLTTFKTATNGVQLAPFNRQLVITRHGAQLTPTSPNRGPSRISYEEAIGRHVGKWLGRYETLLQDPGVHFRIDLTGGRDSRANFGIYLAARDRLLAAGIDVVPPRVHCGSVAGDQRDLEIASEVAAFFGVELNDTRPMPRVLLDAEQRYARWRETCLGTYHPMYLASTAVIPTLVEIGGGGAPNHRRTLESQIGSSEPEDFIALARRRAVNGLFAPEIEADLRQMFSELSEQVGREDILSEYYLHLRGRLHTGRPSKYRVSFHPFISTDLDVARAAADIERLESSQMNYDIMHMTAPDLLDIPFDDETKSPGDAVRRRLVSKDFIAEVAGGKTWWDASDIPESTGNQVTGAIDYVAEAFRIAIRDSFVQQFFPRRMIEDAKGIVETAKKEGKLRHASDAIVVSQVLLAREISPTRIGDHEISPHSLPSPSSLPPPADQPG